MLTQWLLRCTQRVRMAFLESALFGRFFQGSAAPAPQVSAVRLHVRALQQAEQSVLLGAWRALGRRLFGRSVGGVALFLFSASAVAIGVRVWQGTAADRLAQTVVDSILLLGCFPFLRERSSVSACLRRGRLSAPFLFSFCGLMQDACGTDEMGEGGAACPVLLGAALGAFPLWLPSVSLPVLLLMGLALALMLRVPELTVLLLLLLFPFLYLLPHPTIALAAGAVLSVLCFCGKWACGKREWRFARVDVAVVAFAAAYLLSGGVDGALSAVLILCGWFPFRSLSDRWRYRAAVCLSCSAFLCAGVGVVEYWSGRAALRWVDLNRFGDIGGRVCATFSNPNILSVFLLAAYPVALCCTLRQRGWLRRTLFGLGTLLVVFCMVVTWSRGAWLGLIAESVLLLLLCNRMGIGLLPFLSLPAALLLPCLPHSVRNRFSSIGALTESSIRYRLEVWQGCLRMLADAPLGIGSGEAVFRCVWQMYAIPGTETVMHAHAMLLQVALESGVAGAFMLILLLLRLLRACGFSWWSAAGVSALAGLLLMGMFDHLWYAKGMLWLFFAVATWIPAERSA